MLPVPHRGLLVTRAIHVLAAVLLLAFGVLPGSITLCLAAEEPGCACCSKPVAPEQGCCQGEPPPADDDTPCCVSIVLLPVPWVSTTPPLAVPMVSAAGSLLPAGDAPTAPVRQPNALASGPPVSAPTHIRFCCPLA